MQNIMITGAAGFVGSRLARRLRQGSSDLRLTLVDHRPGHVGSDVIHKLDVSEEQDVADFIAENQPTQIIHLAAVSAISNAMADMRATWRVNGLGPINIAMAVLAHVPHCHLIFISSAEVYGKSASAGVALSEQTLLQPANPYASAKAAADLFIQEASGRGLLGSVMRPFNHIGPGQSLAFAIPSFCSQIVNIERGRQQTLRIGSLEDVRDFLHVDDVLDAYLAIAEKVDELTPGAVFNVASGIPVRMQDLFDQLVSLSRAEIKVELDETRLRQRPATSVVGDATKLRKAVGWAPQRSLAETLEETLEFWRSKP